LARTELAVQWNPNARVREFLGFPASLQVTAVPFRNSTGGRNLPYRMRVSATHLDHVNDFGRPGGIDAREPGARA
jgi:hypothetical protein